MSKKLLLAIIILAALLIQGCEKDTTVSLRGTTWSLVLDTGYSTITFERDTYQWDMYFAEDQMLYVDKGTYTYNYPKATLNAKTLTSSQNGSNYHVEDLSGETYEAIFDGDVMTLYWEDISTTMTRSK